MCGEAKILLQIESGFSTELVLMVLVRQFFQEFTSFPWPFISFSIIHRLHNWSCV
jgi:hypothetical protein